MLIGTIKAANVVGTPKPGDVLKLKVVYDAEATANEAPWTVAVVAKDGATVIGFDNTTHLYNKMTGFSVEFTCSIPMPSTARNITLELYGHPDSYQRIEDYV